MRGGVVQIGLDYVVVRDVKCMGWFAGAGVCLLEAD